MRITVAAAAVLSTLMTASVHGADAPALTNPAPSLVTMEPIETPIMGVSRIEGRIQVAMVLEARNEEAAAALEQDMPRLRATSLASIIEYGRLHASGFRATDVEAMNNAVSASLKADYPGVRRVLVVRAMTTSAG